MKFKAAGYGLLTVALVAGLALPTRPVLGHGGGVFPVGPPLRPRAGAMLPSPGSFVNYETPHVHPLDINAAATFVAACNTPDGFVEIYSVDGVTGDLTHVDSIRVGYAPVSARFRTNDELWVVNHLSDTISVLSIAGGDVIRTLQTFDGYDGTHAGDEPADVVFTSTGHALVSGSRSDVIQRYTATTGAYVDEFRLDGEDPRMLATNAAGTSAYAAIFESGNGSTIIQGAPVMNGGFPGPMAMNDPTGPYGGVNPPFNNGIPGSAWIADGVSVTLANLTNAPPRVPIIVKKDAGGAWRDDNGADWTPWITGAKADKSGRFTGWDLLDNDVAILTSAGSFTTATYATRQMNHVMAVAVDPATGEVFSVGTDAINELRFEPNVNAIFVRVMLSITNAAGTVQNHLIDLNEEHLAFVQGGTAYSTRNVSQGDRDDSIGDPRGIAFKPGSGVVYISGMGSNNLVVVNTADGSRRGTNGEYTIEVGRGPTGIVHHPTMSRLYVLNKFDASITTIGTGTVGAEIIRQTLPFFDPTPAFINTGRVHLYSTHDSSGLGQVACGSCHIDGRMDRMAWDLGNPAGGSPQGVEHIIDTANILNGTAGVSNFIFNDPNGVAIHTMKGPMTTQTLQDIIGHEPLHWRGDRDGVEEFSGAFQGLQGDDVPLASIPMQDFEDFLSTIHFPPNPFRPLDNSLPGGPALVGAGTNPILPLPGHVSPGVTLFKTYSAPGTPLPAGNAWTGFIDYLDAGLDGGLQCAECHALPMGSGPVVTSPGGTTIPPGPMGQAHVGMVTIDGTGQPHMKVPQTRNQFDKEGFFLNQAGPGTVDASLNPSRAGFGLVHDGTVDGLTRFLGEPVFSTPTDQDLADIVAFALCLNGDGFSDLFALPGGPVNPSPDGGVTQAAHAAVGHQVTTTSGSPPAGDQATIDLLVTLASQDKIGLIAMGAVGGGRASWYHVSGTGAGALFQRDNNGAKDALSTVQGFASAGDPLTFMAVPMVSEVRMGVDRDEDGGLNAEEATLNTDPVNPLDNMFVDAAASGSAQDGTPGDPFLTVTPAVNATASTTGLDAVVHIKAGTYADTGLIDNALNTKTVLRAEGGTVTIGM